MTPYIPGMARTIQTQVRRILRDVNARAHHVELMAMGSSVRATVPDAPDGSVELTIRGPWHASATRMLVPVICGLVTQWQQEAQDFACSGEGSAI